MHRQIASKAKTCRDGKGAGQNFIVLQERGQFGELTEVNGVYQGIAPIFLRPFSGALKSMKNVLVGIDIFSAWPIIHFCKMYDFAICKKIILLHVIEFEIPKFFHSDKYPTFFWEKTLQFLYLNFPKNTFVPKT